jgi:hypothetical protein
MSQRTFNTIVRDCVPFLYSCPTYSLKSARFRYLRAKVVMATLNRYLAIQSDQLTLGKEFGVRLLSCVSKRIESRVGKRVAKKPVKFRGSSFKLFFRFQLLFLASWNRSKLNFPR